MRAMKHFPLWNTPKFMLERGDLALGGGAGGLHLVAVLAFGTIAAHETRMTTLKTTLLCATFASAAFADTKHDPKFVEEAAGGGLAEVKLSSLASTSAADPAVRELASSMMLDHTKANAELKTLAAKKSLTVPTELPKDAQKKYDSLVKLSGAQFDKEYVAIMVDDHKKTVKLFEAESEKGKDSELKAWAGTTLPKLKHHLEMVQSIEKNVKSSDAKN